MRNDLAARAMAIFEKIVERSPEDRRELIESECGSDSELRVLVDQILRNHDAGLGSFLRSPLRFHNEPREPDAGASSATLETPARELMPPRIGPYRVLQVIGAGGMGEVYEAEQEMPIRRRVALKVIKRGMDTEHVIARFEAERQALALMDHTNVAKVFEAGSTDDGRPYFVMEYVRGVPITEHCDRHCLGVKERLELFMQACEGVQHAHQRAVIHRDLKPSNILVAVEAGKATPKIIDFGVAKAIAQPLTERTLFTQLGQLIGTPTYMSPEQAEMSGLNVDTRTDIYSLGVLLYELLVGGLPFEMEELRQAGFAGIQRILKEVDPPKPSTKLSSLGAKSESVARQRSSDRRILLNQLRGDLDWITMKALERDRTRRYASASEFAADVARFLAHEPVSARPPSTTYRFRKLVLRHRTASAFTAALVGLAIASILSLSYLYGVQRHERMRADAERERAVAEEERAREIAEFLQGMLASASPYESKRPNVEVRELLAEAARLLPSRLDGQPRVRAAVEHTIADAYLGLGLNDEAEAHARTAIAILEEAVGPEHPEVAESLHLLGHALHEKGEYEEAESAMRRDIALHQQTFGAESAEVATSMAHLQRVVWSAGRHDEAIELARGALEMRRRLLGPLHADVGESVSDIGNIYMYEGDYTGAAEAFREAISIYESGGPANQLEILRDKKRLASVLGIWDPDESKRLMQEVVDEYREIFGQVHPNVASALNGFGTLLRGLGEWEAGVPIIREAFEQEKIFYPESSSTVLHSMTNLATAYHGVGDYESAEPLYRKAISITRQTLGADHPDMAVRLQNLARMLWERGDFTEAGVRYHEALVLARRHFPESPLMGWFLTGIGNTLVATGQPQEAERWLRDGLAAFAGGFPPDDWQVAAAKNDLGDCLRVQGRYAEAEPLLLESNEILQRGVATARHQKDSLKRLAALYRSWDKPEKEAPYREQLVTRP